MSLYPQRLFVQISSHSQVSGIKVDIYVGSLPFSPWQRSSTIKRTPHIILLLYLKHFKSFNLQLIYMPQSTFPDLFPYSPSLNTPATLTLFLLFTYHICSCLWGSFHGSSYSKCSENVHRAHFSVCWAQLSITLHGDCDGFVSVRYQQKTDGTLRAG